MAQINPDDGKIYLDNTILRAVAECDTKSVTRHGFDFAGRDTSAPLVSGQAAHEAFAHFMRAKGFEQAKGRPLSARMQAKLIDDCLTIFTDLYSEVGLAQPNDDRLSLANTQNVMRGWLLKHVQWVPPFRIFPELVEIGFAVPLDDEQRFMFCGRLDALVQAGDGQFYVLDHKTTGRMDSMWRRTFRMDSQFSGYQWAAQQHFPGKPITGTYINALEFSKLPGPSGPPRLKKDGTPYKQRECAVHSTTYDECRLEHITHNLDITIRTDVMLANWRATAITLAKRFARLLRDYPSLTAVSQGARQQGFFNQGCKWCEFTDWCGTGRPPEQVRVMYEHRPWRPFEYAFPPAKAGTADAQQQEA